VASPICPSPLATDLFSKFDPLIAEREALLATGVRDPFSIVMTRCCRRPRR
jgi:8-amino-7-oxononanoate synthase